MHVLIVEDEKDTLAEISEQVQRYKPGWTITVSDNPVQVLQDLNLESFDLALLDIQMPQIDGLMLAELIIEKNPSTQLIFITAYNHYATEAFEVNALDYILKPIRSTRLEKALDRIWSGATEQRRSVTQDRPVKIQVMGKMMITYGDTMIRWKRQKSAELFAYLLDNLGMPVNKDKICDRIWPDYEPQKALVNMQTAMCQLRKNLSEITRTHISINYSDNCYCLTIKEVAYDLKEFINACSRAAQSDYKDYPSLVEAEKLYTANYLEEQDWIWARERNYALGKRYAQILKHLIRIEVEKGKKTAALDLVKRGLGLGIYEELEPNFKWIEKQFGKQMIEELEQIYEG